MAEGIADIMELDMVAFGNAYWITKDKECGGVAGTDKNNYTWASYWDGYNATVRDCFNTKCGAGARTPKSPPFEDCYTGEGPFCQHGAAECTVNLLQMCAKSVAGDWTKYFPFAECLEAEYGRIASSVTPPSITPNMVVLNLTVQECAKPSAGGDPYVDYNKVLECYKTQGKTIQVQSSKATPPHPGTPFVQVTNKSGVFTMQVPDSTSPAYKDSLLKVVCSAWQYNGGQLSAAKGCPVNQDTQEALVI